MERVERGEEVRGREIIRTVDVDEAAGQGAGGPGGATQPPAGRGAGRGGRGGGTAGSGGGNAARDATTDPTAGTLHRLILQDAAGTKAVAIELIKVDGIGVEKMSIGAKMVLKKGATVARGMVLMEPETTTILGGKIEAMHREWKEGRKARLIAQLEQSAENAEAEEE